MNATTDISPVNPIAKTWLHFGMCALLFVCSGATCFNTRQQDPFQPRVVFETRPDINQLAGLVNNSLKIQSLESHTITVSSPDIVARLRGKIKWARPDQFQLEAFLGTKLAGTALGAGSNSEQFLVPSC